MYDDRNGYRGYRSADWLARGASMTPVADVSSMLLTGPTERGPTELDQPDPPPRRRVWQVLRQRLGARPRRLLRRRRAHVVDGI